MEINKKVIWAEGVFLGQQHFQQWEQDIANKQQLAHIYHFDKQYGLCQLEIDEVELEYGFFKIKKILCLMPDGRWSQYDSSTADYELSIPLTKSQESIYLALPKQQAVAGISGYPERDKVHSAWKAKYQSCQDIYDSSRQREVLFAVQQLSLVNDLKHAEQHSLIKIAELAQNFNDKYQATNFVPTVMQLQLAPALLAMVHQLTNELKCKISHIKIKFDGEPSKAIQKQAGLSYSMLLISIMSKYLIELNHFLTHLKDSPKELYYTMTALQSELVNFAPQQDLTVINYEPDDLYGIFSQIHTALLCLLKSIQLLDNEQLQLIKARENLYLTEGLAKVINDNKYLYLEIGLSSVEQNDSWIKRFEGNTKLGAKSQIDHIYAAAITGIQLRHSKRPPTAITVKPNCEYYQILCEGEFWQQAVSEDNFAILMTEEFSSLAIELIIIDG